MGYLTYIDKSENESSSTDTIDVTLPASIQNGDWLIAILGYGDQTVTAPAGWTHIITTSLATDGTGGESKLSAWYKTTVLATDSGDPSGSWTIPAPWTMTLSVGQFRPPSGHVVTVEEALSTAVSSTANDYVTPPTATATKATETFIYAGQLIYCDTAGTMSGPTGATKWSGNLVAFSRYMMSSYQTRTSGQSNSGNLANSNDAGVNLANVGITIRLSTATPVTVTEGLGLEETDDPLWRFAKTNTEGLAFAHTQAQYWYAVKALTDGFALAHTQAQAMKYGPVETEDLAFDPNIYPAWPKTITNGLGLAAVLAVTHGKVLTEGLGFDPSNAARLSYRITSTDGVEFETDLSRFIGGAIVEGLAYSPAVAGVLNFSPVVTESLITGDVASPKLVFRITATDELGLEDVDALKLIFNGTLTEGIEFSAIYVAPDGSTTTWAINTRTGSVTEYTNYEFNSFAKMGNKYLAASSDGLYELLGDDDNGTDIIAKMKTGYAQFAGSHLCHFKAIYLGVRNGGTYYLRIETAEGTSTVYQFEAEDMKTTRIQVGKGLRARYFAFELQNVDGQDFDLESIEFVPLVVQRRR